MQSTHPRHNGAPGPWLENSMKPIGLAFGIVLFAVFLASCQRGASINAQVQSAIAQHLAERPGIEPDRLLIEVQTVTVQGERAEAEVIFRSRDNPESRMAYHYELRREDGAWKVAGGRPSAAESPHPVPDSAPDEGATLPEGHPPVEGNPHQ